MQTRFSEELEKVVDYARDEAMRTGYYAICTEHLLLGVLRHCNNSACRALEASGMDLDILKRRIDAQILRSESIPYDAQDDIFLSRDAQNALSLTILEASLRGIEQAGAADLLLAITKCESCPCRDIFLASGISHDSLLSLLAADPTPEGELQEPSEEDMRNAILFGLDRIGNYLDTDTKIAS